MAAGVNKQQTMKTNGWKQWTGKQAHKYYEGHRHIFWQAKANTSYFAQTWIQDLLIQDQDQDTAVSRPRPRLWCPRPRPRLKTYKTNTGSPWLGWTVTNTKTENVMASKKSSIPVVAHSKQQNIIPCLTTVLFRQLPLIIAVYKTLARTYTISKVRCLTDN